MEAGYAELVADGGSCCGSVQVSANCGGWSRGGGPAPPSPIFEVLSGRASLSLGPSLSSPVCLQLWGTLLAEGRALQEGRAGNSGSSQEKEQENKGLKYHWRIFFCFRTMGRLQRKVPYLLF